MEEDNKIAKNPLITLAIVFIVGAVAGFFIKSALKTYITSSPDDRKITVAKQTFDFKAAQAKLDKEMEELQQKQEQTHPAPTGGGVHSDQPPTQE